MQRVKIVLVYFSFLYYTQSVLTLLFLFLLWSCYLFIIHCFIYLFIYAVIKSIPINKYNIKYYCVITLHTVHISSLRAVHTQRVRSLFKSTKSYVQRATATSTLKAHQNLNFIQIFYTLCCDTKSIISYSIVKTYKIHKKFSHYLPQICTFHPNKIVHNQESCYM